MTVGKSDKWLKRFKDIDAKVIECVERVWPLVISRLHNRDIEDKITERLVDILRTDREIIQYGFLDIQFKLRMQDAEGDFTTKGILDMALFLDQDHEKYIAYECKRLNTVNAEGKRIGSIAGPYVEEGVIRYVTAKYSEKLPYGCMIAYVMDGDVDFAVTQVLDALKNKKTMIDLQSDAILVTKKYYSEFETSHIRKSNSTYITVRHRVFSMAS